MHAVISLGSRLVKNSLWGDSSFALVFPRMAGWADGGVMMLLHLGFGFCLGRQLQMKRQAFCTARRSGICLGSVRVDNNMRLARASTVPTAPPCLYTTSFYHLG